MLEKKYAGKRTVSSTEGFLLLCFVFFVFFPKQQSRAFRTRKLIRPEKEIGCITFVSYDIALLEYKGTTDFPAP